MGLCGENIFGLYSRIRFSFKRKWYDASDKQRQPVKRLALGINYLAALAGLIAVFFYLAAVYMNGGYGPRSVADGVVSSGDAYVLVLSSFVGLTTLLCGVAIAARPLVRRLAAAGLVLGMVALPIAVAYLQVADIPIYGCPMMPLKSMPAGYQCPGISYAASLSSEVIAMFALGLIVAMANLYFTWKPQKQRPSRGRAAKA